MIARADIVAQARLWLGTPFQHQAHLRGVACDCIGLVAGVADELGMPEAADWFADPRFRGYGPLPLPEKLCAACDEYLDPIAVDQSLIGDILVMTYATDPMHFGLITATAPVPYLIHSSSLRGKVVEHCVDATWRNRVLGAYRYRGVE